MSSMPLRSLRQPAGEERYASQMCYVQVFRPPQILWRNLHEICIYHRRVSMFFAALVMMLCNKCMPRMEFWAHQRLTILCECNACAHFFSPIFLEGQRSSESASEDEETEKHVLFFRSGG